MDYKKAAVTSLVLIYCFYYLSTLSEWHFIDNVNLIIHEAGHVVFLPFGYFLTVLGGTLMQLIIPLLFIIYFVYKDNQYSASLLLYWLGINLFNISVYAGDALKMQLPLLTGDKDGHDWNQMLFVLGWFKHVQLISGIIWGLGVLIILLAFAWGIYSLKKESEVIK